MIRSKLLLKSLKLGSHMLQKFIIISFLCFATPSLMQAQNNAVKQEQQVPEPPEYNPLNDPKFFPPEEAPKPPPVQEEGTGFFTAFINMVLVLLALIAFLYFSAYLMKKFKAQQWEGANKTSDIQVLERRVIAPKAALYIVQVKDKKFLIAETPHGLASLSPYERKDT